MKSGDLCTTQFNVRLKFRSQIGFVKERRENTISDGSKVFPLCSTIV